MGLNVKAAVLMCAAIIGIAGLVLGRFEIAEIERPVAWQGFDEPRGRVDAPVQQPSAPLAMEGPRESWVRQLARRSAVDRQAVAEFRDEAAPAVAGVAGAGGVELIPIVLPPRVRAVDVALALEDVTADAAFGDASPRGEDGATGPVVPPDGVSVAMQPLAPEVASEVAPQAGAAGSPGQRHEVARGETLTRIAAQYYGSREARYIDLLMKANPSLAKRDGRVRAGEVITVPPAPTTVSQSAVARSDRGTKPDKPARGDSGVGGGRVASSAAEPKKAGTASPRWYTIQKNDSLASIARRELDDPNRWREIVKINKNLDANRIVPGARIRLPDDAEAAPRGSRGT